MFESDFVQLTLTPILAVIGAVFGLIGTVMGVLNYRLRKRGQKIDIRLTPSSILTQVDNRFDSLSLEITIANAGLVSVTVSELGLSVGPRFWRSTLVPLAMDNSTRSHHRPDLLPARIESQDQLTIRRRVLKDQFFKWSKPTFPMIHRTKAVYVKTSAGDVFYGKGKGLKAFCERLAEHYRKQQR